MDNIKSLIAERYSINKEEISDEILQEILSKLKEFTDDYEVDRLISSYFPNAMQFKSAADDFLHALLNAQIKLK
jgi:pyridoxal/pyridoxine/pyridoxamine kinase